MSRSLIICLQYIANLTLAQVKTLDCGSLRLNDFPFQLTLPGTKISTLPEMFDFVKCATDDEILFNIESKVDGDFRNLTRTPEDFAEVSGKTGFWESAQLVVEGDGRRLHLARTGNNRPSHSPGKPIMVNVVR